MKFLPISINISDKEILIVGGGKVAFHKIKILLSFSQNIRIIAKEISEDIKELNLPFIEKEYDETDIIGSFLIYACTNIKDLNQKIYNDALKHKVLINVVDNPALCNFVSPAIYKSNNMTVAVGSNAQDVNTSIRWRDKIKEFFENNQI